MKNYIPPVSIIYISRFACSTEFDRIHRSREDIIPVQRQRPHNLCDEADDGAENARDHGGAVHPLERLR